MTFTKQATEYNFLRISFHYSWVGSEIILVNQIAEFLQWLCLKEDKVSQPDISGHIYGRVINTIGWLGFSINK